MYIVYTKCWWNWDNDVQKYYIPDTILILYIFIPFSKSYFPYDMQNGTRSRKSNGKDNEIEFNFLIICRYLNFVKKSEDNLSR